MAIEFDDENVIVNKTKICFKTTYITAVFWGTQSQLMFQNQPYQQLDPYTNLLFLRLFR